MLRPHAGRPKIFGRPGEAKNHVPTNATTVIDGLEADNLSTSTSAPQLTFGTEESLKQYLDSFHHNFEMRSVL